MLTEFFELSWGRFRKLNNPDSVIYFFTFYRMYILLFRPRW